MKGKISIGEFVRQVRDEIQEAQEQTTDPFFDLKEINLEISFALEAGADSKMNLYVVEVGANATATQTHKVSLKLVPIGKGSIGMGFIKNGIQLEVDHN